MDNNLEGRHGARRREDNDSESEDSGPSWWAIGMGVAAGVAAVAGGIYLLSQQAKEPETTNSNDSGQSDDDVTDDINITMNDIPDTVSRVAVSKPFVNNLNSLLNDIHIRYIAIKKEDFAARYNVFSTIFSKLHIAMKAVDPYYERYSSRLSFKPDEFNLNIVIGLPVSIYEDYQNPEESDIVIEPKQCGFVQLRAGIHYQKKISSIYGPDCHINRQAYLWLDDRKYILRSKFLSWFQSVVDRALNKLNRSITIEGTEYRVSTSFNGCGYTLWITSSAGLRLDVDLVPMLRFPEERWLGRSKTYRDIPAGCNVDYWMVFPKPNKYGANSYDEDRSWHVDMHDQEKKFLHDCYHLRQGMRLLKKLRDAQQMNHIEDIYIKTIFMWKNLEVPKSFWQRDVATIFKVMLKEFYDAIVEKKIKFFWKKSHNLIENIPENILRGYANKLEILVRGLEDDSNYMLAAEYLLTGLEYTEYKSLLNKNYY